MEGLVPKEYQKAFKELNRNTLEWGTFGKKGNEPLKWVILKDMSDEHIINVLITQNHISNEYRGTFLRELGFRLDYPELSIKK